LINSPVAGLIFRRLQDWECSLPIPQYMGFKTSKAADFAYGIIELLAA
jgi:hypothetical protein